LVDQYPTPQVEIHPILAQKLGIKSGDSVLVESRRGELTVPALVVKTIRPDTVFIPYHWPGERSANRVTNRALDPISKIPEFKVCAVRVSKSTVPTIDVIASEAKQSLSENGIASSLSAPRNDKGHPVLRHVTGNNAERRG
jgi:predicted molibdopterin-dependent oxidoreductase YjgC